MKKLFLLSSILVALASSAFADAFTISPLNGGAATGSTRLNLDLLDLTADARALDSNLSISFLGTGSSVVQGAVVNQYARPFISGTNGDGFGSQVAGADETRYLSTGIGSIVFQFTSAQTYFGLLWGSVDTYNTLAFYDGDTEVGSFTGAAVSAAADGNQGEQGTFYVNFDNLDGTFDRVVASSSEYAFEIDNIAYSNSRNRVPDSGTTVALLGLALTGLAAFRRKL